VLLSGADLLGFRSSLAPRLLPLTAGAAVVVVTYLLARQITSRAGAWLAAVLVGTSGSVLWSTAGIAADGPAMVLALGAVALGFAYARRPATSWAVACGLMLGAGLATKALIAPAGLAVAMLLLSRRRPRDFLAAVGSAVVLLFVAALPFGLSDVWDQSVTYHRSSERVETYWGAVDKVVTTLVERDVVLVVAGVVTVIALIVAKTRGGVPAPKLPVRSPGPDVPWLRSPPIVLGAWALAQFVFLIVEPGLWRPHVAHLVAPLALLISLRPPPLVPLLLAIVVVVPWHYDHVQPMLWPDDRDATEAAALEAVRRLPRDAQVITDDPGTVWRAGRRTVPSLADSSIKRIEQGHITRRRIVRAAARPQVCGVLVSTERYRELDLSGALARIGFAARPLGEGGAFYERSDCRA
jgi:4-amino-4-deoxy-L-arabinose transferase-like glycosyltransferase